MNLRTKSNQQLLLDTNLLCEREKETIAELLHHLAEIEARDIHLELSYSSMNEYCEKELGYSKDEAFYRVNAMHLILAVPEAETKLRGGTISLTNLARAQSACRKENKRRHQAKKPAMSLAEKSELLAEMDQKSTRDCQRVLAARFPELDLTPQIMRPVSAERVLFQTTISMALSDRIERLKNLLAPTNFDGALETFLDLLTELGLEKHDPVRRTQRRERREAKASQKTKTSDHAEERRTENQYGRSESHSSKIQPASKDHVVAPRTKRPYQKVSLRDAVFVEADSQCEYTNPITGRRCVNRHAPQRDHVIPFAYGGPTTRENMRILCAAHNQFEARRVFGKQQCRPPHWH